jgi:hypothetical protein
MGRRRFFGSLVIGALGISGGSALATTLALPAGARLVGTAQVDEVRAFPEMNRRRPESVHTEDLVAAGAVDRVYETAQPYAEAVAWLDATVARSQARLLSRTVTSTATSWELRLSDGTLQNVAVRNTQPTTIETVAGAAAVAREPVPHATTPPTPPRPSPPENDRDKR